MLDKIIGLVAPFECLACGREGAPVCADCVNKIAEPKRSTCYLCNRLTRDWRTCQSCQHLTKIRGVIIGSHYEGHVKELVRLLKYHRARAAANCLAEVLKCQVAGSFDLVTAVPAAPRRLRQRGYNPAALIAKALARELNLVYAETLERLGSRRQVGTERRKRLKQLVNSMYVSKPARVSGQRILVVDDVVTTGATISEAGRALKAAGAKYMWGVAVAKH